MLEVISIRSGAVNKKEPRVTAVAIAGAKIEISSKYANGKSPAVPTFRERNAEMGESMGQK